MRPEDNTPFALPHAIRDKGPLILAALAGSALVMLRLRSPGVPEIGDGSLHYLQARYGFTHPELLVNHWAKPLFVLLASPFAQLGPAGLVVFNAVLYVATSVTIASVVRREHPLFAWVAPLALIFAPMYMYLAYSGMTEILFGLLSVLVVALMLSNREAFALALLSFGPVVRPEYVVLVPCAIAWTVKNRRWNALPWILLGSVVYGLSGWRAHGDPLWLFTQDPYAGRTFYGSGAFTRFFQHADEIIGRPLKWAACLSLVAWPILAIRDRDRRDSHVAIFVLAAVPALGIWLLHSYAWWSGNHASLGLLRVVATSAPLLVLFSVYVAAACWRMWMPKRQWATLTLVAVLGGYGYWAQRSVRENNPVGRAVQPEQTEIEQASRIIATTGRAGQRLMSFHPYVPVASMIDPWDSTMVYKLDRAREDLGIRKGDLIAWDSHYGPNEGRMPLERLLDDSLLRVIGVVPQHEWSGSSRATPAERSAQGGEMPKRGQGPSAATFVRPSSFSVWIFERGNAHRVWITDTLPTPQRKTCPGIDGHLLCLSTGEFPVTMDSLRLAAPDVVVEEIVVTGEQVARTSDTTGLSLVFIEQSGGSTISRDELALVPGRFEFHVTVPRRAPEVVARLYVLNTRRTEVRIASLTVVRRSLHQH